MNSIFTVAKYEFLWFVKTKSFYISILILSLLPLLAFFAIGKLGNIFNLANNQIGICGLANPIGDANKTIVFDSKESGINSLLNGDIGKLLVFPPDHIATGECEVYTTMKDNRFGWYFGSIIDINSLVFPTIVASGGDDVAKRITEGYKLDQKIVDESGTVLNLSQKRAAFVVGILITGLFLVFFMVVSTYITDVIIKDKSDKVIETILSSISPFSFLTGRVIAACAAAILQVVAISIIVPLWLVPTAHLLFPQAQEINTVTSISGSSSLDLNNLPPFGGNLPSTSMTNGLLNESTLGLLSNFNFAAAFGILPFVLIGLLLCVSITTFIGALSPSNVIAGRFGIVFVLLTLGSIVLSMFALSAPMPILIYIPIVSIPVVASLIYAGQIGFVSAIASAIINLGFAVFLYYLAIKIYRMNFTMHGKSLMNIKDIARAIRY